MLATASQALVALTRMLAPLLAVWRCEWPASLASCCACTSLSRGGDHDVMSSLVPVPVDGSNQGAKDLIDVSFASVQSYQSFMQL